MGHFRFRILDGAGLISGAQLQPLRVCSTRAWPATRWCSAPKHRDVTIRFWR